MVSAEVIAKDEAQMGKLKLELEEASAAAASLPLLVTRTGRANAAAAAETCRDALMRFARREGPARDALGVEAGAGAGRGVAPDHARAAAWVAMSRAAWSGSRPRRFP